MATSVNLYGVQSLVPTIDNDFMLVYNNNTRSENVNEVRLLVDTSLQVVPQPVNLYLPPTSSFAGIWTLQIYVVDVNGTAGTDAINIFSTGGDNINGNPSVSITNDNGNCVLTVASRGSWTTYGSGGSGGGGTGVTLPYAEFYDLMSNQQLQVGQTYRINDYRAVNYIHGADTANNNPPAVNWNAGTMDNTFQNTGLNNLQPFDGLCVLSDDSIVSVLNNFPNYSPYKVDSNGNPVDSFNSNVGFADFNIHAIAEQTDGKILIGGGFTIYDGNIISGLVRLNADGTIDNTFLTNLGTGINGVVYSIQVQSDGKILVGGSFTQLNGNPISNGFTRLEANGTLDAVFDANLLGGANSFVRTVCIQSDGSIVVGGGFASFSGIGSPYLARVSSAGVLDNAFTLTINGAGGFDNEIYKVIQQPNTDLLVLGAFSIWNGNPYEKLIRMTVGGADDPLFNANFFVGNSFNGACFDIALQTDGFIVGVGNFNQLNINPCEGICRIDPFGLFDATFVSVFFSSNILVRLQSTGKIIVGASSNYLTRKNLYRLFQNSIISPFDAREINTSTESETLVVKALTNCSIEQIVFSETYPQDIINYIAECNKIGVPQDFYDGVTLPDTSVLSGFDLQWDGTNAYFNMPTNYPALFGQFFYIYMDFNDSTAFDCLFEPLRFGIVKPDFLYATSYNSDIQVSSNGIKIILYGLTQNDVLKYVPSSLYVNSVVALGDCYGYINRRQDVVYKNDFPLDYRNFKYRRYLTKPTFNMVMPVNFWATTDSDIGQPIGLYENLYIGGNNDLNSLNFGQQFEMYENYCTLLGGANGYWWYLGQFDNQVVLGDFYDNSWQQDGLVRKNTFSTCIGNRLKDSQQNIAENFEENTFNTMVGNQVFNIYQCSIRDCLFNFVPYISDVISTTFNFNSGNLQFFDVSAEAIDGNNNPNTSSPLYAIVTCRFKRFTGNVIVTSIGGCYIEICESNTFNNSYFSDNAGVNFRNNVLQVGMGGFEKNNFDKIDSCFFNIDCLSFIGNTINGEFVSNTFNCRFNNNSTQTGFVGNTFGGAVVGGSVATFERNSFGEEFQSNFIYMGNAFDGFKDNTIGSRFQLNNFNIGTRMSRNTIGNDCASNIFEVDSFEQNTIGSTFSQNTMTGAFIGGTNFNQNIIGNGFNANVLFQGNFVENVITDLFFSNTINSNFGFNKIFDRFAQNITAGAGANNFQGNIVNTGITGTDFSLATLVYFSYTKTILVSSTAVLYLSYYNGVNQVFVTPINT